VTRSTTNHRALLTAAGAGMAVSAMMQTLLGNATPRIVDELAAPELYGWVAGSYLVCSTLLLPLFSQYTDRLGTRRVLVAGHACFLTGTLLMSWAPTMSLLLAARVVQGIGAAAIMPAVLAALGLSLDASSRARALSRLAIIQLVANLIGPPLGGWFTDGPGWRLGVLTGVPLSLIALLAARSFPTATPPEGWWRITVRGSSPRGAGPGGGLVNGDAPLAQRLHRHGHVRQRGHRPGGGELQAAGQESAQEQQGGDELGGCRAVDRHPGALGSQEGAVAGGDSEGQEAGLTEVCDFRAQGGQRVEQRRHGAAPGGLVPVEDDRGVGQRGQGGHESHDGPGQADVDASDAVGSGLHMQWQGSGRDAQPGAGLVEVLEAGAEHAQGGEHELGVARAQEPGERRLRVGDGGQEQGPGTEGLRPRQLHDGVQRPRRHRRPPGCGVGE